MQNDYDAVIAAGCDGIFTNEPLYAARDYGYRTTTAPWPIDGTYSHGMLVYPGVGPLSPSRPCRGAGARSSAHPARGGGRWTSRPAWPARCARSPTPPARTRSPCGWCTTSRRPSDLTRWAGSYFGVTTDDCPDDVDTSTGYLVALRWDGTLEVFGQPSDGTGMVSLGVTTTSPIVTPVLSGALTAGVAVTSLPVRALPDRGAARTPIRPSDRAGRHRSPRPRCGVPPPCPSTA